MAFPVCMIDAIWTVLASRMRLLTADVQTKISSAAQRPFWSIRLNRFCATTTRSFTESAEAEHGYRQAFDKGFVSNYPLTIKHKNGKLVDVLYNASVYKDDSGHVLGVFATARDITIQNRIEK
jgi:hypothetical protein